MIAEKSQVLRGLRQRPRSAGQMRKVMGTSLPDVANVLEEQRVAMRNCCTGTKRLARLHHVIQQKEIRHRGRAIANAVRTCTAEQGPQSFDAGTHGLDDVLKVSASPLRPASAPM